MLPEAKRVLLTGGSGGIGLPLSALLRDAGAGVTLLGRSAPQQTQDTNYIQCNLGDAMALAELCTRLETQPTDILINMAGINAFCAFEQQPPDHIEAMLRINLLAPMQLVRAVLPGMLARGSGQIVNIGSMAGSIGLPHFTSYAATKAGLKGFSEALRREVAGRGISVTYIAPRAVKTAMNQGAITELNARSGYAEDLPERVAARIFRAIVRDEANVGIGFPERLFAKLNALWPQLVDGPLIKNRHIAETILSTKS